MRRLLIKLVAIQTSLIGWLSYWLFLVYANNPSVSQQLAENLQRFPQLSFSTVDITVLAVIAAFSIILAFKFHRGLKPGIRLERALQMLENLMKRNLILEAQVADLKVEKAQAGPIPHSSTVTQVAQSESRLGSWEKAFRTPLEAGPASAANVARPLEDVPFEKQTGIPPPPPPRVEAKPPIIIAEKPLEPAITVTTPKPNDRSLESSINTAGTNSSWEDSPKYTGESKHILTPSAPPRKSFQTSEIGGLKQTYVPAPAPKPIPPSVIIGGFNPSQVRPFSRPSDMPQASPRSTPSSAFSKPGNNDNKSVIESVSTKLEPIAIRDSTDEPQLDSTSENIENSSGEKLTGEQSNVEIQKQNQVVKKKFPYEEDEE